MSAWLSAASPALFLGRWMRLKAMFDEIRARGSVRYLEVEKVNLVLAEIAA